MAYWEFLLQKEGDRDWLPLETAHVEISEGRYRIIAHTSYGETPVNIRLSQLPAATPPPARKTLQRSGQTNQNGLMVVIPFTHLTPGRWTVTCSAAASGTSDQSPWQYGVQLEVLAIESGMEYWDTELDEAALAAHLAADAIAPATGASTGSSESTASSEAAMPSLDGIDEPIPEVQTDHIPPLEDLPLRLQLQHQALVAHQSAPVTLRGQITSFSAVEGLPAEAMLWAHLRDPETGQVVHQEPFMLAIGALPCRFDLPISLPEQVQTRLLVGELSLWTAVHPPQVLAIQGFTVTLNLDALLEFVANQAEQTAASHFDDAVTTAAAAGTEQSTDVAAAASEPTKVLNPLSPRDIPFRLIYLPTTGLTLPPVIYRPIDKKAVGSPTLPSIDGATVDAAPAVREEDTPASPSKPLTLPPIGKPQARKGSVAPVSNPAPPPPTGPTVELPSFGRSRRSATPPSPAAPNPETPEPSDQPESAEPPSQTPETSSPTFQPDFQSRFWTRLSALAEEAQKAAADYKAKLEAAGVTTDEAPANAAQIDLPLSTTTATAPLPDAPPPNYEVVVYDVDEEVSELVTDVPVVEILQPGEPDIEDLGSIPMPEMIFPQGDLVAGMPLPITIKLPVYPRRLAVKVWVTDIQSRTLVDRPRWLMNWTPTNDGAQTTFLQLQTPLGCLEARFEAIAIDLTTQRESYKTSLVRAIEPTSRPDVDIDEGL